MTMRTFIQIQILQNYWRIWEENKENKENFK